ncbi:MAG: copper amine oxidase N-terminal domain-containing protein [Lachnospiraceae bacterium]|nr:copper amine oxidase N-terminal domain-containing protein [Lachnospiraceae bacterium]
MKKKLALFMAAMMMIALIPQTAFATTANRVTKVITLAEDAYTSGSSYLVIKNDKGDLTGEEQTFELSLSNGDFELSSDDSNYENELAYQIFQATENLGGSSTSYDYTGSLNGDDEYEVDTDAQEPGVLEPLSTADASVGTTSDLVSNYVDVTRSSSSSLTIKFAVKSYNDQLYIPVLVQGTTEGDVQITIDPVESSISSGTYTVAVVNEGATVAAISKKTDVGADTSTAIKAISLTETTAGTLTDEGTLKFKLSSGFYFDLDSIDDAATSYGSAEASFNETDSDTSTLYFDVDNDGSALSKLVFSSIQIYADEDDCTSGDIATITISGAGTTKQSLEVATYVEYGVALSVEDEDLPVIYIGSATDDDNETLEVTFKESVTNSWWANRKTIFEFPDGIDIKSVEFKTADNIETGPTTTVYEVEPDSTTVTADDGSSTSFIAIKNNKMTLSGITTEDGTKAKFEMIFTLSLAADLEEQDIDLTVTGSAIDEDMSVTVAKAVMPFIIETNVNEVNIDYRYVAINDITITEAYAGAFDKNYTLVLEGEDMTFESGFTYEVTGGDIKIDDVTRSGGTLEIEIKSESGDEPGVITLSNLSLYLDRTLPAGDYKLYLKGDAFIENNGEALDVDDFDGWAHDVDSRTVLTDFVTVVTAGRDQDDSTFTTKITVTIGADTITAGSQTITLDVPAYINSGYTMLPVRAVTEAISSAAIVRWDDPTKTVTISFGSRIIVMTIGSKTMTINGTPVAMSGVCEIRESRAFLPLRDLGYALGLGDSKIAWDETTSTATLN